MQNDDQTNKMNDRYNKHATELWAIAIIWGVVNGIIILATIIGLLWLIERVK